MGSASHNSKYYCIGGLLLLLVLVVLWALAKAGTPVTAFRRVIVVNVPREVAWEHFSRPLQWKSWLGESGAPKAVGPTDDLGPYTTATFTGGFSFRMMKFAPYDHWMWSGRTMGMAIDYDHIFESIGEHQTRMVFHQTITGFGNVLLAPLIGVSTGMAGHQAALQRLADEINRRPDATP